MTENKLILAQTLALANAGLKDDPLLLRAVLNDFAKNYSDQAFVKALKGAKKALSLLGRGDACESLLVRLKAIYLGVTDE